MFVSPVTVNLLSVQHMMTKKFETRFTANDVTILAPNGQIIVTSPKKTNLWTVQARVLEIESAMLLDVNMEHLWHHKLGHPN